MIQRHVSLWVRALMVFACAILFAAMLYGLVVAADVATTDWGQPWSFEPVTV